MVLPIKNKDEKIVQYFSLRIPIDERKNAESEKQKYLTALEDMLFMTSHEVRKPLASCMGLLNLIEGEVPLNQLELWNIIKHLKSSALELDAFTKKLTVFMRQTELKFGTKNLS